MNVVVRHQHGILLLQQLTNAHFEADALGRRRVGQ